MTRSYFQKWFRNLKSCLHWWLKDCLDFYPPHSSSASLGIGVEDLFNFPVSKSVRGSLPHEMTVLQCGCSRTACYGSKSTKSLLAAIPQFSFFCLPVLQHFWLKAGWHDLPPHLVGIPGIQSSPEQLYTINLTLLCHSKHFSQCTN